MAQFKDAWLAEQRRRWIRPDARRFLRPDWRSRRYWTKPPEDDAAQPWPTKSTDADANPYARLESIELKASQARIAELQWQLADLKFELVLRRLARKANFNPDQPRVPAGSPEGGQWANESGGRGVGETSLSAIKNLPSVGHNQGPH